MKNWNTHERAKKKSFLLSIKQKQKKKLSEKLKIARQMKILRMYDMTAILLCNESHSCFCDSTDRKNYTRCDEFPRTIPEQDQILHTIPFCNQNHATHSSCIAAQSKFCLIKMVQQEIQPIQHEPFKTPEFNL